MPKISYVSKRFGTKAIENIERANVIVAQYEAQGLSLTLRQIYYQFVSRGFIPNNQKEYKNLGSLLNDARLAGLVDWNAMEDRTRNLRTQAHWDSPSDIIKACANQFRVDRWDNQPVRVEVWIEKDALVGVIEAVCQEMDVPFFSCRGYTSQSEIWSAAMRLEQYAERGQRPFVIHLGDHDPSGIDMTRDIKDRFDLFTPSSEIEVKRIALNMDQVERYNPPPNPAKLTDSRCAGYLRTHGDESWELDALEPNVIISLVRETIESVIDEEHWEEKSEEQATARKQIGLVSKNWDSIVKKLK